MVKGEDMEFKMTRMEDESQLLCNKDKLILCNQESPLRSFEFHNHPHFTILRFTASFRLVRNSHISSQ